MQGEGYYMGFDMNQTEFPSVKHKIIWRCGVLVMPEELSLSDKVRNLTDPDLFESCRQMRLFILHSLSDMYENVGKYDFEPWQLFSFWLNVIGNVSESNNYDVIDVTASMRSKSMSANAKGLYADVIKNTGIVFIESKNKTEIINILYPKMFRAMKEMQKYVRAKKERASLENSFQICDFRKLCPEYKYDKTDKRLYMREIEDRIPLVVENENIKTALDFAGYLRDNNITLKWTGIQNGFSETGQTHYGQGICHIELKNDYWEREGTSWRICVPLPKINIYKDLITDVDFVKFIQCNIYLCNKTIVDACNGGEKSIYACHRGIDINVLNREIKYACRLRNGKHISVYVYDPDDKAIIYIKKLIELEQKQVKH